MGNWAVLGQFPQGLERTLACIDDPIIRLAQKAKAKFFYYLNMALTFAVALEICVALPLFCFIVGWDGLGVDILYNALILAFLSQIPKRFIWRYRPFMVGRAQMRKKTTTSSFPSRAVACATVYSYMLAIAIDYFTVGDYHLQWWHFLLCFGLVILISFARVNLGVHYPTDCIGGFLLGILSLLLFWGLQAADQRGCGACNSDACYGNASNPLELITYDSLGHINFVVLIVFFAASLLVGILMIIPPLQFWTKFIRVFGVLLPVLLFRLVFLCPRAAFGAAIEKPFDRPWYAWLFGFFITGVALALATVLPAKRAMISFTIFYTLLFSLLAVWRLFIIT